MPTSSLSDPSLSISPQRTIIIGDVHGCLVELQELLDRCALRPGDQLIFIGDLIQKGPDSVGVLQRVLRLRQTYSVRLLIGNHEEKFLRYLDNRAHHPDALAQMTEKEDFEALAAQVSEAEIAFLRKGYYSLRLPEAGLLLVHGGIPTTTKLDLHLRDYAYAEVHTPEEKKALRLLTMTRHLNPHGNFVGLGQETESTRFWAETYDGRFGTVLFGHQPFVQPNPRKFPHAVGIDTGCVYGGWLTAGVVEGREVEWVGVEAVRTYAQRP